MKGKILLLADLRGLGETTDPAFYTDAKNWGKADGAHSHPLEHPGDAAVGQIIAAKPISQAKVLYETQRIGRLIYTLI